LRDRGRAPLRVRDALSLAPSPRATARHGPGLDPGPRLPRPRRPRGRARARGFRAALRGPGLVALRALRLDDAHRTPRGLAAEVDPRRAGRRPAGRSALRADPRPRGRPGDG